MAALEPECSCFGLNPPINQILPEGTLTAIPTSGAQLRGNFVNLAIMNGMAFKRKTVQYMIKNPHSCSIIYYKIPVTDEQLKEMAKEIEESFGSKFLTEPDPTDSFNMQCADFFLEITAPDADDSASDSGDSEDDEEGAEEVKLKQPTIETKTRSMKITTNSDGTIVVPPITDADHTLNKEQVAVRAAVNKHVGYMMALLTKLYDKCYEIAKANDDPNQLKFQINPSGKDDDDNGNKSFGAKFFGATNPPSQQLNETVETYDNGLTTEQVVLHITNEAATSIWGKHVPIRTFVFEFQELLASLEYLNKRPDEATAIAMLLETFQNSIGTHPDGGRVARIAQSIYDKLSTDGHVKPGATLNTFVRDLLKVPAIAKMKSPEANGGNERKLSKSSKGHKSGPNALSNAADDGQGTGKGTGKGNGSGKGYGKGPGKAGKGYDKTTKHGKPTRGGGSGGGGGDDSNDGTYARGCFRCGDPHAVKDCPYSTADMREALKISGTLKNTPNHKSNAGQAAETDSDSESDDDDNEDDKHIEIALISIQMRKSMETAGLSKKAIERKIKKFEGGMYK